MLELKYVIENINKSDGTILGYVSSSGIIDGQGEVILNDEFKKMVDNFMLALQEGRAQIKGNHEIDNIGKLIQSVILDTEDGRKKWLVEVKVTDAGVLDEIKQQGVSGFSIGGSWKYVEQDGVRFISDVMLDEFSILYPTNMGANRPANPESVPIMKQLTEFTDRIIFGIKSLNHKLRGTQMKELEELQTSLKNMEESIKALSAGIDEKLSGLEAKFQKSLEEQVEQIKSGLPETITGIIVPMFDEQKKAQAEIETEMKKSLDEKLEDAKKEMVKSRQIHEQPTTPQTDDRTPFEKAAEWRENAYKQ